MPDYARRGRRGAMEEAVSALADELPPPLRLAVAYAPRHARAAWTALLVLDQRLRRAALGASEPLLAQIRLAWWRDRFREPAAEWPSGEPLLAALRGFDDERGALEALVDGWEQILGEANQATAADLAEARGQAVAALARTLGCHDELDEVTEAARAWSRHDLASIPLQAPPTVSRWRTIRLPRPMRPLAILAGLAEQDEEARGLGAFLRIVRLGLFGR
jgi:phytoene synthase